MLAVGEDSAGEEEALDDDLPQSMLAAGEDSAGEEEALDDDLPQPTAVLIRPDDLRFSLVAIWRNTRQAYYVTPCWQADFYCALAYCGFISVSQAVPARSGDETIPLLIPEIQRTYGVLSFADLHIERNVRKRARRYELRFDTRFDDVLSALCAYHDNCWLLPEYCELMRSLHAHGPADISLSAEGARLRVHSVELIDRETGELCAGELGYAIGSVFTSLTGFTREGHPSAGKIQLVGLACALRAAGATLWNLGHPPREASERGPASMLYKKELGVKVVSRKAFLRSWVAARDRPLIQLPPAGSLLPAAAPCGAADARRADGGTGADGPLGGGSQRACDEASAASGAPTRSVGSAPGSGGASVSSDAGEPARGIAIRQLIDAWPVADRGPV